MAAPELSDPGGSDHYLERVPYADMDTGDAGLVEKFCLVIEALHHAAKSLNSQWPQRQGVEKAFL